MRVVNRTAVTVVGDEPYLEWTRSRDADFNKGQLTVVRTRPFGSAFLLPEVDFEEDLQEWVEENFAWMFEFQLSDWTSDETGVAAGSGSADVQGVVPDRFAQRRGGRRRRRHRR